MTAPLTLRHLPLPEELDELTNLLAGRDATIARHESVEAELRRRLAELEWAEALTPQECAAKKHQDWYIDTEYNLACPFCLIERQADEIDQLQPPPQPVNRPATLTLPEPMRIRRSRRTR